MNVITESVVFLQLNLSRMGDKRGVSSEEIEVDADKETVKVRKVIFKSPAFDRIRSLDGEIRRHVRSSCFPYESGLHLLPTKGVDALVTDLKFYREKRYEYIDAFAEIYPTLVREAEPKLRKLFNEKDYGHADDIRHNFGMTWNIVMLQAAGQLEEINSEVFQEERKKLAKRMEQAFEEARLILRETMLNLVSHLRTSLDSDPRGGSKRLATTTVTHLQEFLNGFELRNITDDRQLQMFINQAHNLLDGVDAESLRTSDGFRLRLRSELSEIEESITRTLIVVPKRKIRRG